MTKCSTASNIGNRRGHIKPTEHAKSKGTGCTSATSDSLFRLLEDEGIVFEFLKLPRELRDEIYALVVGDNVVQHSQDYFRTTSWTTGHWPRDHDLRGCNVVGFMLINKQVSKEFREAVARLVPLHVSLTTGINSWGNKFEYARKKFIHSSRRRELLPVNVLESAAATIVVNLNVRIEHCPGHSADDIHQRITDHITLKKIEQQVRAWKQAKCVILHCLLILTEYESNYVTLEDEREIAKYGNSESLYEHFQLMLESSPSITRYSLVVDFGTDWRSPNHFQAGYGHRPRGVGWNPGNSVQFEVTDFTERKIRVLEPQGISQAWVELYDRVLHPPEHERVDMIDESEDVIDQITINTRVYDEIIAPERRRAAEEDRLSKKASSIQDVEEGFSSATATGSQLDQTNLLGFTGASTQEWTKVSHKKARNRR